MLQTTIGKLLIRQALPSELRDDSRVLDGKGTAALFQEIADKRPDDYRKLAKKLSDIGASTAYSTGGFSFGLEHLKPALAAQKFQLDAMRILHTILSSDASDVEKQHQITLQLGDKGKQLENDIYNESLVEGNPFAYQILSKSRGNPGNLRSLRGADIFYVDHKDRIIPIPVLRSYSAGLRPAEYWAGSYGARKGTVDVKMATANSGFLSKQLNQSTHRLVVSGIDSSHGSDGVRGLPIDTDDPDNEGTFLAHPVGGYARNTVLTPKVLRDLQKRGHTRILVRSPMVGGPVMGGVYARDVGLREKGLPRRGDFVGMAAAQSLAEKMTQAGLSSKHAGGVSGASAGKAVTGFQYINCLAAGTLVRMANGDTQPIEDIRSGDRVLGADITGRTFPVRVVHHFENGLRMCRQYAFRVGRSGDLRTIIATPDHKILAQRNVIRHGLRDWEDPTQRRLGDTTRYPYAAVLVQQRDDSGLRHEQYAAICGLLLGDGCYTKSVELPQLGCCDPTQIAELEPLLESLNLKATKSGFDYRLSVRHKTQDTPHSRGGRWQRNHLRVWLEQHGMWGKYCYEKTIPVEVDEWDNASVAALIGGLVVTDGCVYRHNIRKPGIFFASTSRELAAKAKELLEQRFGIYGGVLVRIPAEQNDKSKRDAFRFDITAADAVLRFFYHIPLWGVKRRKLAAWINCAKSSVSSRSGRAVRQSPAKLCGQLPTYDIEIDHPDHLFVLANGLIVSNSLIQVPKIFKGGATHAEADGRVAAITRAPQGGHYITVGNIEHYVPQEHAPTVELGDPIEAGDTLSEGTPNPAKIVEHKGIGAGRKYFVEAFRKAYQDSGLTGHRRNIELLSRGLIDHVQLDAELGDYVPDDIIPYSSLEHSWKPRPGHDILPASRAVGHYLEIPTLHYTIGTKVRNSMLKDFADFGVHNLTVHKDPPPFTPIMVRGMANMGYDPDFMSRFLGSGHSKSLMQAVHRGGSSDESGTSYVPALAAGTNFGKPGGTPGFGAK